MTADSYTALDTWLLTGHGDEVFVETTTEHLLTYLRSLTDIVCEAGTPAAATLAAAAQRSITNPNAKALINLAFNQTSALPDHDRSTWLAAAAAATTAIADTAAQQPGWTLPHLLTCAAERREHQ